MRRTQAAKSNFKNSKSSQTSSSQSSNPQYSCPIPKNSLLKSATKTFKKATSLENYKISSWTISEDTNTPYLLPYNDMADSQLTEIYNVHALFDSRSQEYEKYKLDPAVAGTSLVVANNRHVYYNSRKTRDVVMYDLRSGKVLATRQLPNANYDNSLTYSIGLETDIDLARDSSQNSIWAIYTTEENHGNIVLTQLDELTLKIIKTIKTSISKSNGMENAFIVCGVFYGIHEDGYINTSFDTFSLVERDDLRINLRKDEEKWDYQFVSVNFNHGDEELYTWTDQGVAVKFSLKFEEISEFQDEETERQDEETDRQTEITASQTEINDLTTQSPVIIPQITNKITNSNTSQKDQNQINSPNLTKPEINIPTVANKVVSCKAVTKLYLPEKEINESVKVRCKGLGKLKK